jgi:hypothetical protein
MYYFCTYFDQHYLDKGLALYASLKKHCSPFRLWILCMDESTYRILTDMQLPQVHLISLSDFERGDAQLLQAKQNRSLVEYYFTCTPSLPLYVMDHNSDVDIITYLDADLYFFSSVDPVYRELGTGSVLIIGHRFPLQHKDREIFGIYNVGLLSFRKDTHGYACLHWWRVRCLEWCYDRLDNGRFADQKYLDDWPERFPGVVVLQHKGAGLAPWNLANYSYSLTNGKILVDGQPLIVYHFEGFKRITRWMYDTNLSENKTRLRKIVKHGVYIPYLNELNHVHVSLDNNVGIDLCKKPSIRGTNKPNLSLNMKIFNLIKKAMNPLFFFRKCINNDFILINR